jgi:hypothetical protein
MRKRIITDRERRRISRETGFVYEIAARHGVSTVTLRSWRKHFGLQPERSHRYRSAAFLWLEKRYADLVANPPNWPTLVQEMTQQGIRNRDGGCLKVAALKQTWQRVCEAQVRMKEPACGPARFNLKDAE